MKSIITGSNGFIGRYLLRYLLDKKEEVTGFSKEDGVDILDADLLERKIRQTAPDRIFHLAAQTNIRQSFKEPEETLNVNLIGTLNFLEVIRKLKKKITFISVGSSAEYGATLSDKKLSEDYSLFPSSPYGVSKEAVFHLVRIYRQSYALNLIHVRPFAIIGPGKEGDAVSDFAKGVVQIERGQKKMLEVGDLSNVRDFMDVRDCVRAMELVSQTDRFYLYNICSGKSTELKQILAILIGMAKKPIKVTPSAKKKRTLDDKIIVGDPTRLREIGFEPAYSLSDSLADILDYWRENL